MDMTEEWEKQIDDNKEGELKFPVKILETDDLINLGKIETIVTTSPPAIIKNDVREINLGKSSKRNESKKGLF
jgi:hypothetical protein